MDLTCELLSAISVLFRVRLEVNQSLRHMLPLFLLLANLFHPFTSELSQRREFSHAVHVEKMFQLTKMFLTLLKLASYMHSKKNPGLGSPIPVLGIRIKQGKSVT